MPTRLISDPAYVSGFRCLGRVTARVRSTKPGASLTGNFAIARAKAKTEVQSRAADLGGDTLLDLQTKDDFWCVDARGFAYRCQRTR